MADKQEENEAAFPPTTFFLLPYYKKIYPPSPEKEKSHAEMPRT